jgi:formylglycine-generating enzyme required for sulfatase activity
MCRADAILACLLLAGSVAMGGSPPESEGKPPAAQPPGPKATVYKDWPFDAAEAKRRQEETAKALGVEIEQAIDLGDGVTLTMVLIPAGEFLMGCGEDEPDRRGDKTRHRVTLTQPFWLGKYEVTLEQWHAALGKGSKRYRGSRSPAHAVSWTTAHAFLEKLNAMVPGGGFALPTEAQWEYACRAGTATPFHFGPTITTDQANVNGETPYGDGPPGVNRKHPVAVGSFPPNAWGLHDMHGNLWEWCEDWYAPYTAEPQTDPTGPATGTRRVLHGGSWLIIPNFARSAVRAAVSPDDRYTTYGLRLARPVQ